MGLWIAGMIATPAASRASAPVDPLSALRALPDRTRVVSEAPPDSDPTPPARAVARECSKACGQGGRRTADELPTANIVELARAAHHDGPVLATAPRRYHASVAHVLPPALGPPSALV